MISEPKTMSLFNVGPHQSSYPDGFKKLRTYIRAWYESQERIVSHRNSILIWPYIKGI